MEFRIIKRHAVSSKLGNLPAGTIFEVGFYNTDAFIVTNVTLRTITNHIEVETQSLRTGQSLCFDVNSPAHPVGVVVQGKPLSSYPRIWDCNTSPTIGANLVIGDAFCYSQTGVSESEISSIGPYLVCQNDVNPKYALHLETGKKKNIAEFQFVYTLTRGGDCVPGTFKWATDQMYLGSDVRRHAWIDNNSIPSDACLSYRRHISSGHVLGDNKSLPLDDCFSYDGDKAFHGYTLTAQDMGPFATDWYIYKNCSYMELTQLSDSSDVSGVACVACVADSLRGPLNGARQTLADLYRQQELVANAITSTLDVIKKLEAYNDFLVRGK